MASQATIEALLAHVVADPDDLDARLVYADAIGGERGEAIALAATLARAGVTTLDELVFAPIAGDELALRVAQHRRLRELSAAHAESWVGELGMNTELAADGVWIDQGIVGSAREVAALERAMSRTPITRVKISDPDAIPALLELPLDRIRQLYVAAPLGDLARFARLVAAMPRLAVLQLRGERDPEVADGIVAAVADHAALVELAIPFATDRAIARLSASAVARRLRTLTIGGWDDDPDGATWLADPLAVFAGQFPAARSIAIIETETILAPRRALVLPPIVQLEHLLLDAFEVLLPALADVRELEVSVAGTAGGAEVVPLAGLARAAPHLERLELTAEAIVDELGDLAALPLRRFAYRTGAVVDGGEITALLGDHALESLVLDVGRGDGVIDAIAGWPGARGLRALSLSRVACGDAGALAIAAAPNLAGLRRLHVHRGGTIGAHARGALASIVDLRL